MLIYNHPASLHDRHVTVFCWMIQSIRTPGASLLGQWHAIWPSGQRYDRVLQAFRPSGLFTRGDVSCSQVFRGCILLPLTSPHLLGSLGVWRQCT